MVVKFKGNICVFLVVVIGEAATQIVARWQGAKVTLADAYAELGKLLRVTPEEFLRTTVTVKDVTGEPAERFAASTLVQEMRDGLDECYISEKTGVMTSAVVTILEFEVSIGRELPASMIRVSSGQSSDAPNFGINHGTTTGICVSARSRTYTAICSANTCEPRFF